MFFVDAESKNFFVNGAEEIDFFLNFLCKFETRDCFKLFLSSFVDDSIYWHSIELFYGERFVFAFLVLHSVC